MEVNVVIGFYDSQFIKILKFCLIVYNIIPASCYYVLFQVQYRLSIYLPENQHFKWISFLYFSDKSGYNNIMLLRKQKLKIFLINIYI